MTTGIEYLEFDFLLFFVQVSGCSSSHKSPVRSQPPSLDLLGTLLNSMTTTLERAAEERSLLLNKVLPCRSKDLAALYFSLPSHYMGQMHRYHGFKFCRFKT